MSWWKRECCHDWKHGGCPIDVEPGTTQPFTATYTCTRCGATKQRTEYAIA